MLQDRSLHVGCILNCACNLTRNRQCWNFSFPIHTTIKNNQCEGKPLLGDAFYEEIVLEKALEQYVENNHTTPAPDPKENTSNKDPNGWKHVTDESISMNINKTVESFIFNTAKGNSYPSYRTLWIN